MAGFPTVGLIGAGNVGSTDPNVIAGVSVPPSFALGTSVSSVDGGQLVYVKALSELSAFACVLIYADGTAQMSTTALSVASKRIAWTGVSVPSGHCVWVEAGGPLRANLAANCAPNVPLYTTSTAGVLDDATVSGGLIGGVVSTVSISNATAVTILGSFAAFVVTGATPA